MKKKKQKLEKRGGRNILWVSIKENDQKTKKS